MISIPGSLSFAKLVMIMSGRTKSAGDTRAGSIHWLIVPYNLDPKLYLECVLSTSNAIIAVFLEFAALVDLHLTSCSKLYEFCEVSQLPQFS